MGRGKSKRRPPPPPVELPMGEMLAAGIPPKAPVPAPMSPGAKLPRRERLRGQGRIDALFRAGKIGQSRLVTVRALPSPFPLLRAAFLVGKVNGKAVARGRLRRRLRAVYRESKRDFPLPDPIDDGGYGGGAPTHRGWDLAILPRRGAAEAAPDRLAADLTLALGRAILLNAECG